MKEVNESTIVDINKALQIKNLDDIRNLKANLESKILKSKKVVIIPHMGIDFDAFASAIGISLISSKLQKPSTIIVDDPVYKLEQSVKKVMDDAKKNFNIVNKDKYLKTADKDDLFILTDVNKSNLVCINKDLNNINRENIIIIDHHDEGSTTIDSNYKFIDTNASSASEIIVKLLNSFKIKCTPEVANYLLAGIHLDTNRLTKNTTSDTFKIVAKLMENGASNSVIDSWFTEDFESHKRVLELVSKATIYKYSYAIVLAEEGCEYTREELARVSDYLLKYGVDAAFAIGDVDKNLISISARSKERVNVGDIIKELDGVGNRYSAAAKISNETVEEVGKRLIKLIEPPFFIK